MLDRFTDTAKRLITLARERAEERRHSSLSNEHLLEVFLEETDCFAYRLIMEQSPCLLFVNRELSNRLTNVPVSGDSGINFDDACKKTFERVFLLSDKLKHKRISTGSLLLGMMQAESPRTTPMIRGWGLSLKGLLTALTEAGDPGNDEAAISVLSDGLANQVNRMTQLDSEALQIIDHAQELARSCNNAQVNPHHILLSFAFMASRGVVNVAPFDTDKFDLATVKEKGASSLKGEITYADDKLVYDLDFHKIIRTAAVESFQFGKDQIGATELGLGILHVLPTDAEAGLGGDYYSLRWKLIEEMPVSSQQETVINKPVSEPLVPRVSLRRYNADPSVVTIIPEKQAREWQVMALDRNETTLTVAMVDPFDKDTITQIEASTGLGVAVIKAEPKDLYAAFRINY